ncbi:MAG: mucoidy inhibitor MuiA family protein [Myxococcales bacterium]
MTHTELLAVLSLPLALCAAAQPSPAPELPVREVTVYSDRARVQRRGTVALAGETRVRLPALPPTLDPDSVRLEAQGAVVRGLEVRRAQAGELPRSEAEKLVRELEAARDAEALLRQRCTILEEERDLVLSLRPEAVPQADPKAPPQLFEAGGWKSSLAFVDARAAAADEALRVVEAQLRAQERKTAALVERARQLAAPQLAEPGWTAEAVVEGQGQVELTLAYVASGARWYPAYDLRMTPGQGEVQLDFAGLVSQETGEDWNDARLSLSTAVPATTSTLPTLRSWKIGERAQFVPTSMARAQPAGDASRVAARIVAGSGRAASDADLRARLDELIHPEGVSESTTAQAPPKESKAGSESTAGGTIMLGVGTQKVLNVPGLARIAIGDPATCEVKPLGSSQLLMVGMAEGRTTVLAWKTDGTRVSYTVSVRKKDPNESIEEVRKLLGDREGISVRMIGDKVFLDGYAYTEDDKERVDQIVALYPSIKSFVKLAPGKRPEPKVVEIAEVSGKGSREEQKTPQPDKAAVPVTSVAFGAPPGWSPGFAADLPAALAGGYDFVYPSARPESVRSGGEARRVVLHSARLPAVTRLSIYPGVRQKAFLVAEITNATDRPLLQGQANLFVGADLQGQAVLDTTAAGQKAALPLGVDDAVQVRRNVELVTRETGVFTKDDVTTYEVAIEILNPRPAALDARVVDQVPLKGDQQVQVAFDRADPQATPTKDEGQLEWAVKLLPGKKQVLRFAYTVTRPRGAQLRQW